MIQPAVRHAKSDAEQPRGLGDGSGQWSRPDTSGRRRARVANSRSAIQLRVRPSGTSHPAPAGASPRACTAAPPTVGAIRDGRRRWLRGRLHRQRQEARYHGRFRPSAAAVKGPSDRRDHGKEASETGRLPAAAGSRVRRSLSPRPERLCRSCFCRSLSVHGRAVKCAGALMDELPVGWWWVCAGGGVGCVCAGAQPYLGPRSWVLVLDRRHDG